MKKRCDRSDSGSAEAEGRGIAGGGSKGWGEAERGVGVAGGKAGENGADKTVR